MFHLLLAACLTSAPDICAERLLPSPEALTEGECTATAEARAADWIAGHDTLTAGAARCVETEALPALALQEVGASLFLHLGQPAMPDRTNRGEIANLGVILGETSIAVIDAGATRAEGEALFAAIRRHSDLPISALILTHMHPDHVLGAQVFREAGARIIGAARLAPALDQRAETYIASYTDQIGAAALLGTRVVLPDDAVETDRTLDLGGRLLRLQTHPTAHTDNDLTVLDETTGTLFSGDLVFNGLLPTLDGSLKGWLAWLDAPHPEIRRLVPGHGPAPLPWPDGAAATRAYLVSLRDDIRAALAKGEPMSAAIRHRNEDAARQWEGYDLSHPRNASAAYAELEWE